MEEAALEEWFAEKKERLEHEFFDKLMLRKNPEAAKKSFDKKYRQLIKEYQLRQNFIVKQLKNKYKLKRPESRFERKLNELQKIPVRKYKQVKKAVQQWFFDQRVKLILRRM